MEPNMIILVLKVLDMLAMGLERRGEIKTAAENLASSLRDMIKDGREPTQDEWDELFARIASAESVIDTRAEEARALLDEQETDDE